MERQIKPVENNYDKQRTYRQHKGRYKLAIEQEFFFEALLIDYALLEDRLRSIIYHMGFLSDRSSTKVWKKKKEYLQNIVENYKNPKDSVQLGITNITGKIKIVRCVLRWAAYTEGGYSQDKHLTMLKSQCESVDVDGVLFALERIEAWCKYRNEVIHCLMNKNLESLSEQLKEKAEEGMDLANYLDAQCRVLKKRNKIRKSANLQTKC